MGASNAGTSNDSGGKDTKTPFGTASSTKTKDKFGYTKPKNTLQKIADKSPVLNLIKNNPISKKTEEVNRKFYNEKVVPAGKSKAPNYETYMKNRLAGKTDAYGNTINNQGGGSENNTISQVTASAPTVAEVDQATTDTSPTETAETTEANRLLKIKKKGRSQSIISGSQGVTKTSTDYSLGKKSLLGRV